MADEKEGKYTDAWDDPEDEALALPEEMIRREGGGAWELISEKEKEEIQAQVEALTDYAIEEAESVEGGESTADLLRKAREGFLKKITEQLGSNEGGWYLDEETGKRYYIKFYWEKSQAQVEYIASAIYGVLGIPAAKTRLGILEGRNAILSEEIIGAEPVSVDVIRESEDIRNGFVADAFLGNWDSMGAAFDNIVRGGDGRLYRIDQGGSLIYRAMGERKMYNPNIVEELATMRMPRYNSGLVFKDILQEEIGTQARHLVERLSDAAIEKILEEAESAVEVWGSEFPEKEMLRSALIGRRDFLKRMFMTREEELEGEAVGEAVVGFERLMEGIEELERKKIEEEFLDPHISFLADGDQIENQQIDVLRRANGKYRIIFKLRGEVLERALGVSGGMLGSGELYVSREGSETIFNANEHRMRIGELDVTLSAARRIDLDLRTCIGLIAIDVPENIVSTKEEFEKQFAAVCRKIGLKDPLTVPSLAAEEVYKRARVSWQYPEEGEDSWRGRDAEIRREEVFPGYRTFVIEGRKEELTRRYSNFYFYHRIVGDLANLMKIIKSGGLLATHERYKRGAGIGGGSSYEDMNTGGADYVFTRLATARSFVRKPNVIRVAPGASGAIANNAWEGVQIIIDPKSINRTDFFAYPEDRYGSTRLDTFEKRLSPEKMLEQQNEDPSASNEQMFRFGIPVEAFRRLVVQHEEKRSELLGALRENGIEEINGIPIEEFVLVPDTEGEVIDVANGLPKGTTALWLMKEHQELASREERRVGDVVLRLTYGGDAGYMISVKIYGTQKKKVFGLNLQVHESPIDALNNLEGALSLLQKDRLRIKSLPSISGGRDLEMVEVHREHQEEEEERLLNLVKDSVGFLIDQGVSASTDAVTKKAEVKPRKPMWADEEESA